MSRDVVVAEGVRTPYSKAGTELKMYCAAGMVKPVEEARQEYERLYGVRVHVEYGPSGLLLGTKVLKEPGDLFLHRLHDGLLRVILAARIEGEDLGSGPGRGSLLRSGNAWHSFVGSLPSG